MGQFSRAVHRILAAGILTAAATGLACDRSERAARGEVLATVGKHQITQADLDRRLGQLPDATRANFASPETQAEFLNMLVEEKLILLAAEDRGLTKEPDLTARIEDARGQLVSYYFSDRVLRPLAEPDSAEIARYYAENPEEFEVAERVAGRQIVVADEGEARTIRRLLLRGAPFDSLVAKRSIDPQTRNLGGSIGYVSRGMPVRGLGPDERYVEAVMAVPVGEISQPIRTAKGYHLVRVESHEPHRVRDLASVREALARKLLPAKFQAMRRRILDSLRVAFAVKVDTLALLGDESYRLAQAKELFDRAQLTEDSAERLKLYEQVVAGHGDSKYAAQAQFMIGFIYAEELHDRERARAALNTVLERYANSDSALVNSARWMLYNMDAKMPPAADAPPAAGVRPAGETGRGDEPRGEDGGD